MVTFIDSFDEMPVLPVTEEMRSFAPTVEPPSQQCSFAVKPPYPCPISAALLDEFGSREPGG